MSPSAEFEITARFEMPLSVPRYLSPPPRPSQPVVNARETIVALFDADSFVEHEPSNESSCLVGEGFIDQRKAYLIADAPYAEVPEDFATLHGKKMNLLKRIEKHPHPLIVLANAFRLYQPKGMFIATPGFPDFLMGKTGATAYLRELGRLSGVVPTVALCLGKLFGGGTLNAPLCDAYAFIRKTTVTFPRPDLYKRMTRDAAGAELLGDAEMHCSVSGLGDALVDSRADGVEWVKRYLSYFPTNFKHLPPVLPRTLALAHDNRDLKIEPLIPFDVRKLIDVFVDPKSFFEIKELYAREVVTGFARLGGVPIGIVANNSKVKSGAIFPETCKKVAKFVSLCDSFSIPIVMLADTPGFMVGAGLDQAGAVKLAALVCSVLAKATVPKALVIVRNAFGGGLFMTGPGFMDTVVAFPQAKIGPFGAATIRPPESRHEADAAVDMQAMSDMGRMMERGLLDQIVEPATLREYLIGFLGQQKRRPPDSPRTVLCL